MQIRMLLNIGIDLFVGVVPFVGDAVDFLWKSNAKNFALLERHAPLVQSPTRGDWLFVAGVIGGVLAMALVPLVVLYLIVQALMSHGLIR